MADNLTVGTKDGDVSVGTLDSGGVHHQRMVSNTSAGSNDAVSVGTSAAQIVAANANRRSLLVRNNHATNVLYVGTSSGVTTSTGIPVAPGESISFTSYTGAVHGIASAASTDVRFFEEG